MNPRHVHWALVIGGIAAAAYLAGLTLFALNGCAAEMPDDYAITIVTTADAAYHGPR